MGVALPYGIEDFPLMDIVEAPEVRDFSHPLVTTFTSFIC